MTRILSFRVTGLAGRREPYEVELADDLNIFFGLNGSGKTTLLKLLYAAIRNDSNLVSQVPFSTASVTFSVGNDGRRITRTITKSRSGKERHEMLEFADGTNELVTVADSPPIWTAKPRDARPYPAKYLSIARLFGNVANARYYYATATGDEFDADTALNETFVREVRGLWRQYTNRLLSEVRQVQQQGLADIMQSLFSGKAPRTAVHIDAESAYDRTNDFLARQGAQGIGSLRAFQRRYDEDPRLRSVVENINDIERAIEIAEEPRKRLEALVHAFISGPKGLLFTDEELVLMAHSDGQAIPLGSLSSGEKQLLRILLETISARDSVVIVDEPELSMHIDWQYQLMSSLRTVNPDCQLIVATHSPEIMAEVSDERIFRL